MKKGWTNITVNEAKYHKLYREWKENKSKFFDEEIYTFGSFVLKSAEEKLHA